MTPYGQTQEDADKAIENTRSESYQKYQGEKLAKRFNALSYYILTKSMDSHHLGRGVLEAEEMLERIQSTTLVIGISSDLLFPVSEQRFIAKHIPGAKLEVISSIYGHDGFLIEHEKLNGLLKRADQLINIKFKTKKNGFRKNTGDWDVWIWRGW